MDYNAGDVKQVNDRAKKAEIEREQELEDVKDILSAPSGVRFFKRFFKHTFLFASTFTGNSYSYFNEGQRNVALRFFGDICEAAPEKVAELMIKEKIK